MEKKRVGRPKGDYGKYHKENRKSETLSIRLSSSEMEQLLQLSNELKLSKGKTVAKALEKLYKEIF